jgi:hypothetical protein
MRVFAILITVATIYFAAHDVALAPATIPNAAPPLLLGTTQNFIPPLQGLSTPVTSNGHELHDVVQLAGGKLSNPLRHSRAAPVDEENSACFIVNDGEGKSLAYVYFEDELGRRSAAHLMTRDEARRIAVNMSKLPELLGRGPALSP